MAWLPRSLVWFTVTCNVENAPRPETVTGDVAVSEETVPCDPATGLPVADAPGWTPGTNTRIDTAASTSATTARASTSGRCPAVGRGAPSRVPPPGAHAHHKPGTKIAAEHAHDRQHDRVWVSDHPCATPRTTGVGVGSKSLAAGAEAPTPVEPAAAARRAP